MGTVTKKYFIQQYLQENYSHGGIGCTDAENIFLSAGFQPVFFPEHEEFSLLSKVKRFFYLLKVFFTIKKKSVIIFLFPVYAKLNWLLLRLLRKIKNIQVICVIADIDGLKDGNDKLLKREIKFLKLFRFFIAHNDNMKDWIYENISKKAAVSTIQFFDFFAKPFDGKRETSFQVAFAGNLAKSSFLEKLQQLQEIQPSLHFHIYGIGQSNAMLNQKNVTYHGWENPTVLPQKIQGSFGLVWDGDSIETPAGKLGDYMHYISHHKLSLYILSKLPIIVPTKAGSSAIVTNHKIGLAVDSLNDIEDKIKKVSVTEFEQMQMNMDPLAQKIAGGKCLTQAIGEIMNQIGE